MSSRRSVQGGGPASCRQAGDGCRRSRDSPGHCPRGTPPPPANAQCPSRRPRAAAGRDVVTGAQTRAPATRRRSCAAAHCLRVRATVRGPPCTNESGLTQSMTNQRPWSSGPRTQPVPRDHPWHRDDHDVRSRQRAVQAADNPYQAVGRLIGTGDVTGAEEHREARHRRTSGLEPRPPPMLPAYREHTPDVRAVEGRGPKCPRRGSCERFLAMRGRTLRGQRGREGPLDAASVKALRELPHSSGWGTAPQSSGSRLREAGQDPGGCC